MNGVQSTVHRLGNNVLDGRTLHWTEGVALIAGLIGVEETFLCI